MSISYQDLLDLVDRITPASYIEPLKPQRVVMTMRAGGSGNYVTDHSIIIGPPYVGTNYKVWSWDSAIRRLVLTTPDKSSPAVGQLVVDPVAGAGWWVDSIDNLIESGPGYEIYQQAAKVFERVSLATDRSTEELFLYPKVQGGEAATGAIKATGAVQFTRTENTYPVVIQPGTIVATSRLVDRGSWTDKIPVKKYQVTEEATITAGDTGPVSANVESVVSGWQMNIDANLIDVIDTPVFSPEFVTVADNASDYAVGENVICDKAVLDFGSQADGRMLTVVEANVAGDAQTVIQFTMLGDANVTANVVTVANTHTIHFVDNVSNVAVVENLIESISTVNIRNYADDNTVVLQQGRDSFIAENLVAGSHYAGSVMAWDNATSELAIKRTTLDRPLVLGETIRGETSNVETQSVSMQRYEQRYPADIEVTNAAAISGGRFPSLDAIGQERGVYRQPGESDTDYRDRIANVPDIITPHGIVRSMIRQIVPYGYKRVLMYEAEDIGAFLSETGDAVMGREAISWNISDLNNNTSYREYDASVDLTGYVAVSLTEMRACFDLVIPAFPSEHEFLNKDLYETANQAKAAGVIIGAMYADANVNTMDFPSFIFDNPIQP